MPDSYKVLLPPLLTPTLWESRGNIPALVRLLRAFLTRGANQIVAAGQVTPMLGIFQHLIQSKANDQYGFELLEALLECIPLYALNPSFYIRRSFADDLLCILPSVRTFLNTSPPQFSFSSSLDFKRQRPTSSLKAY